MTPFLLIFVLLAQSIVSDGSYLPAEVNAIFRKGPYLRYPGHVDSMTVHWQLKTSTTSTVLKWGLSAACTEGSSSSTSPTANAALQYEYTITGLTPNTRYYYCLTVGGTTVTNTFYSASAARTSVNFMVFGDIQDSGSTWDTTASTVLKAITAKPEFQSIFFSLGDHVGGEGTSETDWDSIVFGNSPNNIDRLYATVVMMNAPGNHDAPTLYRKYFPYTYCSTDASAASFDYGSATFIMIDTEAEYTKGSEQYGCIETALVKSTKQWKIPMFHRPGWTTGENEAQTDVQTVLHPLFQKHGVKVVYMAHNHHFSWLVKDEINYMTVGPVGASVKPYNSQYASMVQKYYLARHFTAVAITGGTLTMTLYKDTALTVIDTITLKLSTVEGECGNGVVEPEEECDDGNIANGDGCSETCERETIIPIPPTLPPTVIPIPITSTVNPPIDRCVDVECISPPTVCFDDFGVCDNERGICIYAPRTDGVACGRGKICQNGRCLDISGTFECLDDSECFEPHNICLNAVSGVCNQTTNRCTYDPVAVLQPCGLNEVGQCVYGVCMYAERLCEQTSCQSFIILMTTACALCVLTLISTILCCVCANRRKVLSGPNGANVELYQSAHC